MKLSHLKSLCVVLVLLIAFSCNKEEESPHQKNNSVFPGDFLAGTKYTKLVLEVGYVEGFEPTTTSLNNLVTFLNQRLNKPGGITISKHLVPSPGRTKIDADVIREIEKSQRQKVTDGDQLTAWLYFVDAEYTSSTSGSKVLGVAYGPSSIAVFEKTVREFTGGIGQPSAAILEMTILGHEFGHILGLVNNGTTMVSPHQDTNNNAHCSDTECLMYYKAQTQLIAGEIAGEGVPALDANCIADLKAAGGK